MHFTKKNFFTLILYLEFSFTLDAVPTIILFPIPGKQKGKLKVQVIYSQAH